MINLIKNIIFYLGNFYFKMIYLFCCLFPIDKRKIFANHFDGKPYGDSPKYILEELKKMDEGFKIYWTYNKSTSSGIDNITYVKYRSVKYIYHLATSTIWISTVRMPYFAFKRKNQRYYFTWHGTIGIKKIENECPKLLSSRYKATARHDSKMIDYFISDNNDNTNQFEKFFWAKNPNVLKYGSPRNDPIYRKENKGILNKKYGIIDKKVLLYAPTFRNNNSFEQYNIDYHRLISSLNNRFGGTWVIVVRVHPRLHKLVNDFLRFDENVLDGSKIEDIQEVLIEFDAVITDYSSIIFDYIILNKPAFIYAKDIVEYTKERDFHLNIFDLPFSIAENNDQLNENIRDFNEEEYKKSLNDFKNKIQFYNEYGDSSKKCALHILEQLKKIYD